MTWTFFVRKLRSFAFGSTDALLFDDRFIIDDTYFKRRLKFRNIDKYELSKMKVKDIKRCTGDGNHSLYDVEAYKYLDGAYKEYDEYCEFHRAHGHEEMDVAHYDALIKSIEENGYDNKHVIIVDYNDVVKDGQHRSCCLLHNFGPDFEVPVLRVKLAKRTLINKIMRFFYKYFVGFVD